MAKADLILEDLLSLIETRIDSFNEKMPKVQRDAYNVILDLTGDLETSNGRIKATMKNVKLISKIKQQLSKVIFTKEYEEELDKIVKTYGEITKLQNQYFTAAIGKFSVPKVLAEVQQLAIEGVVDAMGLDAVGVNVISPVRDILVKNVTTGGSKAEFLDEVREYLLDTERGDGKLVKYTKQIVTDSLNQYSANYTQIVSDDLGLEWFKYVGSNKETTRPFCKALTNAKQTCMPFIHRSQLPDGMIPGTNAVNFPINRGGYNCNHQLVPVSAALVPKALRDEFKGR
jgi:hypothetical protein